MLNKNIECLKKIETQRDRDQKILIETSVKTTGGAAQW
jgi:hypothetical protein